jgi:hypothetical protein
MAHNVPRVRIVMRPGVGLVDPIDRMEKTRHHAAIQASAAPASLHFRRLATGTRALRAAGGGVVMDQARERLLPIRQAKHHLCEEQGFVPWHRLGVSSLDKPESSVQAAS